MLPERRKTVPSFNEVTFDCIVKHASASLDSIARIDGPRRSATDRATAFALEMKPRIEIAPASRALISRNAPRSISVHPGSISWHEFHSAQPDASARFLSEILEGDVITRSRGEASEYTTVMSQGLHVAGGVHLDVDEDPHWSTYLRVPNVDVVCELALECGGSVRHEPSGILGLDRRAVISDPTGATLTVISGGDDRRTIGSGSLGWDELRSTEPMVSVRFWCSLFDWTASPLPNGRDTQTMVFVNGGRAVASLEKTTATERESRWLPIATVHRENFNATLQRAKRAGASMRVPPSAHAVLSNIAIMVDRRGIEVAIGAEPTSRILAA